MVKQGIIAVILIVLALGLWRLVFAQKNQPQSVQQTNSVEVTNTTQAPGSASASNYLAYTPEDFAKNAHKKRVYFFHAAWCPYCVAADKDFLTRLSEIPEDVVLFKTNYDTESELKKKYAITYQHTFVYVDNLGNVIKKWNGGETDELIQNTKDQ